MTNPLTTPSSVPATTPVPRNPDGSPLPRARMKAAIARVHQKLDAAEESYEFSEEEAAAWMERHPEIVNADLSQAVEMEVQEPKWVSDDEAAKIRADIATDTDNQVINPQNVDFSCEHKPGIYTDEKQQPEEPKNELTPQQKRAATIAAKKAAKEAQNNG